MISVSYSGNSDALARLSQALSAGEILPFVGSGASTPLFPTWNGVLTSLATTAQSRGLVTDSNDIDHLARSIATNPLEAANSLEKIFNRHVFRALIEEQFETKSKFTNVQEAITKLGARTIITTNYDDGIELAAAENGLATHVVRNTDESQLARWRRDPSNVTEILTIIHWHGVATDGENLIFTSDDYYNFYKDQNHLNFLADVWQQKRLLVVGFGFSDPFLTSISEKALRLLKADNSHFAFIGVPTGEMVSNIARREFSQRFRLDPIFYEVKDSGRDHSELYRLLCELVERRNEASTALSSPAVASDNSVAPQSFQSFERDLFVFEGRQLYVEPRLTLLTAATTIARIPEDEAAIEPVESGDKPISIAAALSLSQNLLILTRPEFGSTTLALRIAAEIAREGKTAHYSDANKLPQYRAKLQRELPEPRSGDSATLILDSFNPERHERLLKEVIGLSRFQRLVIIVKADNPKIAEMLAEFFSNENISTLRHEALSRADIRSLATTMLNTSDIDLVSLSVERTYIDLLALCIPLTPTNVIMYLRVVAKDEKFSPLNRIEILERYLKEILSKPSDEFKESFNINNRIDVTSNFLYKCFESEKTEFSSSEWNRFCIEYKEKFLVEFDARGLLNDLIDARILVSSASGFYFKYRFFYAYFLGRHIAGRGEILKKCIEEDAHLQVEGLVEVVAALANSADSLVEDLTSKLEVALAEFWKEYSFPADPFQQLNWPASQDEQERLWEPIFKELAAGPIEASKLDELKRSIQAEKRTEHQQVTIIRFDELENKVSMYAHGLAIALISAESLSGTVKKAAVERLLDHCRLGHIVGLLQAPLIAKSRIFLWNGLVYRNYIRFRSDEEEMERTYKVANAMATSIATTTTDNIGSKRLGEVFKSSLASKERQGIERLVLFSLLLKTKPSGWLDAAENILRGMGRNEFYLIYMLTIARRQFFREINTNQQRAGLKRIIATIWARRDLRTNSPGEKTIKSAIQRLEDKGYFDDGDGSKPVSE